MCVKEDWPSKITVEHDNIFVCILYDLVVFHYGSHRTRSASTVTGKDDFQLKN
jgi:hypothetical protein